MTEETDLRCDDATFHIAAIDNAIEQVLENIELWQLAHGNIPWLARRSIVENCQAIIAVAEKSTVRTPKGSPTVPTQPKE
jgi:hypothetical protein